MVIKALSRWWANYTQDPVTRYLSQSTDTVDLERRQQALQRNGYWL